MTTTDFVRSRNGAGTPGRRTVAPGLVAAIFVMPYLILMLSWAFSNPPGSAPDEPDHLVKALGIAKFNIGTAYDVPSGPLPPGTLRNDSIARNVPIPAQLSPAGYTCDALKPDSTAACLPKKSPTQSGTIIVPTAVGAYPPYLYLPIGLVAVLTGTPSHAFIAARLVCVLMSGLLLWLGCRHLARWLGPAALLGAAVAFTPMTVFTSASVGLSGVEISGAFAVAAIAVTAIRRRDSLAQGGTQLLLAGVGSALILSRQLGIVTFGAVILLLMVRLGWGFFWDLIKARRPAFLSSVAILIVSAMGIASWETRYDHPALLGHTFSMVATRDFSQQSYGLLQSAIGSFGWLDTLMPRWAYAAYLILLVMLVGLAILVGSPADRWSLVAWLVAAVLVAYVTFSTVFFPIGGGLQGRHLLPFFMMVPLLAGVVVAERLGAGEPEVLRRLINLIAFVMPTLQLVGLYMNARRYAVGANGPIFFLGRSEWRPPLGWTPWLVLGVLGAILLAFAIAGIRPARLRAAEGVMPGVDG